ncbi:MAG: hypothetical protein IJN71_04825 [Oscillospiraceae bacterium]|nr:hypothetical protein [Oscillospiraceae bacterium]
MKKSLVFVLCLLMLTVSALAGLGEISRGIFGGVENALSIAERFPPEKVEEVVPRGNLGYVVSATQYYNIANDSSYVKLNLINETGQFEVCTIENVENYYFEQFLEKGKIGVLRDWSGSFVRFKMKKTNMIQYLDNPITDIKKSFSKDDGFYLVNVIDERNGIIFFYETASDIADVSQARAISCEYHENGHAIITIDGGEYTGDFLVTLSEREESIKAGYGNAIIHMVEGQVMRVFSFTESIKR